MKHRVTLGLLATTGCLLTLALAGCASTSEPGPAESVSATRIDVARRPKRL